MVYIRRRGKGQILPHDIAICFVLVLYWHRCMSMYIHMTCHCTSTYNGTSSHISFSCPSGRVHPHFVRAFHH